MFMPPDWPSIYRHFARRVVAQVRKHDPREVDLGTLIEVMFWAYDEFHDVMHLKENVDKVVQRILEETARKRASVQEGGTV